MRSTVAEDVMQLFKQFTSGNGVNAYCYLYVARGFNINLCVCERDWVHPLTSSC